MERAAQDRDDWTLLRVATPDRPGGLAVFARCMAACGVDILSIEILGHEGPKAVADVLVHGGDLDRALRALDEDLDLLGRRSHGDLPDPALAMAEACGIVFGQPSAEALLDAAMRLVGADVGAVYRVVDGELAEGAQTTGGLESLARQALARHAPAFAEPAAGSALAIGLDAIAREDKSFDAQHFLTGARAAYDMIVTAYAAGDRKQLKNLLGKEVYDGFETAIKEREQKGETVETRFVAIDGATITAAEQRGKTAQVTVRFQSQLVSVTRAKDGTVIDGNPDAVTDVTDVWTFARDVSSRDPNWKLVATEAGQ